MDLLRALLFLRFMSLRNVLHSRLRRLRQPKYLVGAIAGAVYFWFFFFRHTGKSGLQPGLDVLFGEGRAEIIAAGVLTVYLLITWVTPGDHPGLAFTEAEVTFLFPAPLARRQLIHYKLIDGLLTSLLGAVFFTLISAGLRNGWIGALRYLGAWWAFNSMLSLHQTAAALTISRLSARGLRTTWRRVLLLGGFVALVVAGIVVAMKSGPESLSWVLWPARLAVRPFLSTSPGTYLLALCPAIGLVIVHYFWVHQMESPFEEASIANAQKRGEMVARLRAGKGLSFGGGKVKAKREPFRLGDKLPPEAAFLWKNLMAAPSYINRKVFFGAAGLIFLGLNWLKGQADIEGPKIAGGIGFMSLVLLGYLLVFGPQLARNDLRGDLLNADMLKAYPLPGWRIVLGGLLAPTVILTGVAWLFLLTAAISLPQGSGPFAWFTPSVRTAVFVSTAVVMPILCAIQLLIPNAATLIFPAWAPTNRVAGGGMDVMGQRLIFFAGQIICLLLVLLCPAVMVVVGIVLTWWLIGLSAAIFLVVPPVLAVLIAEFWLGVRLLGPRFEKLDISAELRP